MVANTKLFAKNWKKLTSDKYIWDIVTNGLRLDFKEIPKNRQYQFRTLKNDELDIVKAEVDKLLSKQVICESRRERNDYLSNVFTRNKKDGGKRMILNLKQFNTRITYRHFKMGSINQVIDIIRPNVYMASIDLKDAFYSIPIHHQNVKSIWNLLFFQKYLNTNACLMFMDQSHASLQKYPKFPFHTYEVKGLYQWYLLMIHNYRLIITKHVFTTLKIQLNYCIHYYSIHPTKSILTPTQRITLLGFVIDSIQMTLEIPEEKKNKIHNLCLEILQKEKITLRTLASVIGKFVTSFPAVPLDLFFIEIWKNKKYQG